MSALTLKQKFSSMGEGLSTEEFALFLKHNNLHFLKQIWLVYVTTAYLKYIPYRHSTTLDATINNLKKKSTMCPFIAK